MITIWLICMMCSIIKKGYYILSHYLTTTAFTLFNLFFLLNFKWFEFVLLYLRFYWVLSFFNVFSLLLISLKLYRAILLQKTLAFLILHSKLDIVAWISNHRVNLMIYFRAVRRSLLKRKDIPNFLLLLRLLLHLTKLFNVIFVLLIYVFDYLALALKLFYLSFQSYQNPFLHINLVLQLILFLPNNVNFLIQLIHYLICQIILNFTHKTVKGLQLAWHLIRWSLVALN